MAEPQPTVAFEWTQPSAALGSILICTPLGRIARHLFTASHFQLRGDAGEWQALAAEFAVAPAAVRLVKQVHRADVAIVRRDDRSSWTTPEADIIVSDDPAVVIGVRIADCAPILIADPMRRAVGAVHAGWRGTAQQAARAGIAAMTQAFGSDPADLVAAIGPCLGVCCGEVGRDVVEAFQRGGHDAGAMERWFSIGPGGRFHLALAQSNRDQLATCGLRRDNIHLAGLCTRSYPDVFHSYRAAGSGAGRMAALIRCP